MYFLFIVLNVVADDDDNNDDDDDDDDSSIPCLVSLSLLFYLFPIQAWAVRDAYVYVLLCKLCWQDLIFLLCGDGDASVLSFLLPIQAVALRCTSTMCMLVVVAIFFFTMRHFVIEMLLIYHQHI